MFEIKVADDDVTSGTISISWCLDLETLSLLRDQQIKNPQVVIVVAPVGAAYNIRKEYRKVVPLKDLITYIEFRIPGVNKIWAFISTRHDTKSRYLSRSSRIFETTILDTDGNDWSYIFPFTEDGKSRPIIGATPVTVDVPAGVFAPEPSQLEKDWVNHFFKDKCVDQCEFRRRRLFAYGVQPFIMLVSLLIRFILLLAALLIGAKNTSFTPLLHPLTTSLLDAFQVCEGGSIFVRHLPEDDKAFGSPIPIKNGVWATLNYLVKSFWLLPLMPVFIITLGLAIYFHGVLILSLVVGLGLTILIIFLLMVAFISGDGIESITNWLENLLGSASNKTYWYMKPSEMDLLECAPEKKPLTLQTLPAEKKTLRLRYMDLKSKICKPFSA